MTEANVVYSRTPPINPESLFDEIKDFVARVDEGHSTAEVGLARIIEHIAINNPMFITETCLNAGVTVPCDCMDHY